VQLVYLSGDRLYTAAEETLYVYSISQNISPILSGDRLYTEADETLHAYSMSGHLFPNMIGDRFYTEADETLNVDSVSDHTSLIATYQLGGRCISGIIADNYLCLGGYKLQVFEVTISLTQPLVPVKVFDT